jgi:hypothetical protein
VPYSRSSGELFGLPLLPTDALATGSMDAGRHRRTLDHAGLDLHAHCQRRETRLVTAARLKRMDVTADFPDLVFFGPRASVFCGAKAKNGRSEAQAEVASRVVAAGYGYLCSSDYRDVIET